MNSNIKLEIAVDIIANKIANQPEKILERMEEIHKHHKSIDDMIYSREKVSQKVDKVDYEE